MEKDNLEKDWANEMGFKDEKEYNDFLNSKFDSLFDKIENDPKLLDVFKRLKDK
jgi:hypothetical protein